MDDVIINDRGFGHQTDNLLQLSLEIIALVACLHIFLGFLDGDRYELAGPGITEKVGSPEPLLFLGSKDYIIREYGKGLPS
jgi:hypothetical protein